MDITGKFADALPMQSGTSTRGEWKKQEFIIETEEQFPKKVCISVWGDKVQDIAGLRKGESITVSINIESREYNGRWYTDVRAWRIQRAVQGQQAQDMPPVIPPPAAEDDFASSGDSSFDDLPF